MTSAVTLWRSANYLGINYLWKLEYDDTVFTCKLTHHMHLYKYMYIIIVRLVNSRSGIK